jgi:hypothetical protein
MMDDHQIGFCRDRQFDRREAGIHSGDDARDRAVIGDLQAVDGAVVVADFAGPQCLVAKSHHRRQGDF